MTLRVKSGWQKFCRMPFQCDVDMSDTLTHFLRMTFFLLGICCYLFFHSFYGPLALPVFSFACSQLESIRRLTLQFTTLRDTTHTRAHLSLQTAPHGEAATADGVRNVRR